MINLNELEQLNTSKSNTNSLKRSLSYNSTTSSSSSSSSTKASSIQQASNKENKTLYKKTSEYKPTSLSAYCTLKPKKKDSLTSKIDLDKLIMSQSSLSSNGGYSLVDPNKIHLFVKAGQDGRSQGACPFCQDVFIQLLIKAQS